MADMYTIVIPTPEGVPETVEVHVMASRRDGKPLTREELEALVAVYPPPTAEGRATMKRVIERAPSGAAKASTKPRKPASKRAAAKRP